MRLESRDMPSVVFTSSAYGCPVSVAMKSIRAAPRQPRPFHSVRACHPPSPPHRRDPLSLRAWNTRSGPVGKNSRTPSERVTTCLKQCGRRRPAGLVASRGARFPKHRLRAGDLRLSPHPPRPRLPDLPGRHRGRHRPRSGEIHPHRPHRPPPRHRHGGLSPSRDPPTSARRPHRRHHQATQPQPQPKTAQLPPRHQARPPQQLPSQTIRGHRIPLRRPVGLLRDHRRPPAVRRRARRPGSARRISRRAPLWRAWTVAAIWSKALEALGSGCGWLRDARPLSYRGRAPCGGCGVVSSSASSARSASSRSGCDGGVAGLGAVRRCRGAGSAGVRGSGSGRRR
jgi:hypothetical protein